MTTTAKKRDWQKELENPMTCIGRSYKNKKGQKCILFQDRRFYDKEYDGEYAITFSINKSNSYATYANGIYSKGLTDYQLDIIDAWEEPVVPKKVKLVRIFYWARDKDRVIESDWYPSVDAFIEKVGVNPKQIIKEEWQEFDEPAEE